MLAFFLALALYAKALNRMPVATEVAQVRTVVHDIYKTSRRAQPKCPAKALNDLKSNARIVEIVDVAANTDVEKIATPHSFVSFRDFKKLLRENRVLVAPQLGVFMSFDGEYSFGMDDTSCTAITREELKQLFLNRTHAVALVRLQ
jgi:hypothetical protein